MESLITVTGLSGFEILAIAEAYLKAGSIASEVRNHMRSRIRAGASVLEVCEEVEKMIIAKGGKPAFPCNLSLNDMAAHYTASTDDQMVIAEGDLIKLDIGVHVDGYIADTATTVSLNPAYDDLARSTQFALEEAIKIVRADVKAGEIGRAISLTAARRGFKPISNLCGHLIEPFRVHAGTSIPNVWVPGTAELRPGQVYAIEPFLTVMEGSGTVVEGDFVGIYSLLSKKRVGEKKLDDVLDLIWDRYRTLPFAERWLSYEYEAIELRDMLSRLVKRRLLRAYPVLVESSGRFVAQAEHTISPTEMSVLVLTR